MVFNVIIFRLYAKKGKRLQKIQLCKQQYYYQFKNIDKLLYSKEVYLCS